MKLVMLVLACLFPATASAQYPVGYIPPPGYVIPAPAPVMSPEMSLAMYGGDINTPPTFGAYMKSPWAPRWNNYQYWAAMYGMMPIPPAYPMVTSASQMPGTNDLIVMGSVGGPIPVTVRCTSEYGGSVVTGPSFVAVATRVNSGWVYRFELWTEPSDPLQAERVFLSIRAN